MPVPDPARADLEAIFRDAVRAVDPGECVRRSLAAEPLPDDAAVRVLAMGKAAVAMTRAAVDVLGPRVAGGVVVTPAGEEPSLPAGIGWMPGAHPVPDATSVAAGRRLLDAIEGAAGHGVLLLLSGGASSLACAPAEGLDLDDLARTNRLLPRVGGTDRGAQRGSQASLRPQGGPARRPVGGDLDGGPGPLGRDR